ncbi:TPA: hypothetical protein ACNV1G_004839 [Citrobacter amalonaticus]
MSDVGLIFCKDNSPCQKAEVDGGFSFLTEGKKSKGNPEKQAQRLRRVSPCFSYNKEKD